jgi:hypothetical protein
MGIMNPIAEPGSSAKNPIASFITTIIKRRRMPPIVIIDDIIVMVPLPLILLYQFSMNCCLNAKGTVAEVDFTSSW